MLKLLDQDHQGHPKLQKSAKISTEIFKKIPKLVDFSEEFSHTIGVDLATINRFVISTEYKQLRAKWVPNFLVNKMKNWKRKPANNCWYDTTQKGRLSS